MGKNNRTKGGRHHYIMTLIFTLVSLYAIVAFTFLSFYFIAREDAVRLGEVSVSEQSEKLNNFLLRGKDVVEVVKISIEHMMETDASSDEIQLYLTHQSREYSEKIDENFTGIYALYKGEYVDGMGWTPSDDYDPISRPWYEAAKKADGKPVIVSPYIDAQTDKIMISISQMLSDKESVISLDIAMDDMQDFAESINLNGNGYGFIIDEEGMVVAHSDESQRGKNYLYDGDMQGTKMQEIVRKVIDSDGKTVNVRINGEDSRVFSKVVQGRWHVVMIVNVHDLFKKVETNLVINILLSLVIFGSVAYFISSSYKNRTKALKYAEELKEYQATLEERVEEQTVEIKEQAATMVELQKNTVEGMATLIQSRDGYTGEHVKSTKKYVSMIVNYMYDNNMYAGIITKSYVKKIENAATLHDVGKIKISDIILNKPGKFTEDEYEIMKTHTSHGGEIVKDILGKNADEELVQIATDVAKYHHEKWDGSGYPEGLKGKDIPLSARIMAVADVFDALISKRVYKEAMSIDEAFCILKQDAGSHFDPEIIDVFVDLRPQLEEHLKSRGILN